MVGVPLAALVVWAIATRPRVAPTVQSRLSSQVANEGDTVTWRVDVSTVPGLRDVVGHLPGDRWTTTTPEHGHVTAAPSGAATVPMAVLARIDRWGVLARPAYRWAASASSPASRGSGPSSGSRRSPPCPRRVRSPPGRRYRTRWGWSASTAALGSGRHRAGRDPPVPHRDRLRRIHWPVSLRTGALHVTTTYADQDAEVRLVLDAIRDLGERDPQTGRRSSLDVAVEAAGAVAAHYLGTGDRVGLSVLGGGGMVEAPAVGGHHQVAGVLLGRAGPSRAAARWLTNARCAPSCAAASRRARSWCPVRPGVRRAARARGAAGSQRPRGLAVDTLPVELQGPEAADDALRGDRGRGRSAGPPRAAAAAARPRARGAPLRMAGVPVIAWRGPGSLDTVLRQAARRSRAPRVASR